MTRTEMMPDEITDRLSEYLRGALPEAERQRVAAHLQSCPVCRSVLAELQAAASSLTHAEVMARVPGYVEGELPLSEWMRFVAHLETCPVCWQGIVETGKAIPLSITAAASREEAGHG